MCAFIEKNKLKKPAKSGVNLIIFSKDRAMQLEALFQSLRKYASGSFCAINVLYDSSSDFYQDAYNILINKYQGINFLRQTDFYGNVKALVYMPSFYTMFLTDDDLIFSPFFALPLRIFLRDDMNVCCFSYRLGLNINYCYSSDKPNPIGIHSEHTGENHFKTYITWNWREQELDWGYPLSVTSHCFKRALVKKLIKDIHFVSPNDMEAKIQCHRDTLLSDMAASDHSCIVGVPANRVNQDFPNRNGLKYPYSTAELNTLFLTGKRIDINQMDFSNINAAQQELKYVFKDVVG